MPAPKERKVDGIRSSLKTPGQYGMRLCRRIDIVLFIVTILILAIVSPPSATATSYSWTGTTSNAWDLASNWGGSGFPNSYSDTATIGIVTNTPVTISNTMMLGTLTITNHAGTGVIAVDIAGGGILGMQGGITLSSGTTNGRELEIDGTLRNDAASSFTTYTISGGTNASDFVFLNGGTISSLNGGIWAFARPINGFGTISSPFTNSSTIAASGGTLTISGTGTNTTANITAASGATLRITGTITLNAQRVLGGSGSTGGTLSIDGGTVVAGTTGCSFGCGIDNYDSVNLHGTFDGITLYRDGSGSYNLTGDSSWNNGALNTMSFNGHKLDATGSITNFGTVSVGTGILNNPGASMTTISNGNFITLAGGQITNTGGGGFSMATNIRGYGTIGSPIALTPNGGMSASGGTLSVTQPLTITGSSSAPSIGTLGAAGDVLDISTTVTNSANPVIGIYPGTSGVVNLDGATLNAGNGITFNSGAINVTNNSTLTGPFTSTATLQVNSGEQLTLAGATLQVNSGGTLKGEGTVVNGSGTNSITINSGGMLLGGTGLSTTGTLTVQGAAVTMTSGSIISLALGPLGTHSTIAMNSSTLTFASNQAFKFIDLGAQTGTTYLGIITGVPDPGTALTSWQTIGTVSGTFAWDPLNNGEIDLVATSVPEEGIWIAGPLAMGAVLLIRKRRIARLLKRT